MPRSAEASSWGGCAHEASRDGLTSTTAEHRATSSAVRLSDELERTAAVRAQIAKVTTDPKRAAQLAEIAAVNPDAFTAVMATEVMRASAGYQDRARREAQRRGRDERGRGM